MGEHFPTDLRDRKNCDSLTLNNKKNEDTDDPNQEMKLYKKIIHVLCFAFYISKVYFYNYYQNHHGSFDDKNQFYTYIICLPLVGLNVESNGVDN